MQKNSSAVLQKPASDGGYQSGFLGPAFNIKFPELNPEQKKDIVKLPAGASKLDYIHYSVVLSKKRQLAYFTAVNIDGTSWQDNPRKGDWQDDPRIKAGEQLGQSLYDAKNSDFDRGHLVRREDPEWGEPSLSIKAGINTFWFPNCTPQHLKLNQRIWAELEANILHTGADKENLKINVFTGPVLSETDGIFVTKVNGRDIQLPNLFWKVVVWTKSNKKAYAVGFLMSQEKFLLDAKIIKKQLVISSRKRILSDEDIFEHLKFKDGKTYQVKLDEIEKLSGLKFNWPGVIRPFKKTAPAAITGRKIPKTRLKRTRGAKPSATEDIISMKMNIKLSGLTL
jgi:endonuclease G, mitochondrial